MYWDPKALFLDRDSDCQRIGKQSALVVERCGVWRRGRERVSGSVSLTYGAIVLAAEKGKIHGGGSRMDLLTIQRVLPKR